MDNKKFLQKASATMEKKGTVGDFTSYCKTAGFSGVCQECINHAAKEGGHASKMALFAVNANQDKYTYPKGAGKSAIHASMKGA
jgi:hypothetical protein